jgi:hypothetical protein
MPKSEGAFLRPEAAERPKEAIEYEMTEMWSDLPTFADEERPVVLRYLERESLEPREAEILRAARARWFEEKYGIPYRDKSARRKVIMRKYAPPEELAAARALQKRMFEAISKGAASEDVLKLKMEYLEKYPDQMEGVELVFGIRPFLELSHNLNDLEWQPANNPDRMPCYEDLTESHFLLTHFVTTNGNDKEFLKLFWATIEKIAAQAELTREMNNIRKGTVTQIATFRVFEKLGMKPKLSHPCEDAFDSIDLWSDATHPIQVKSTGAEIPEIVETDEIAFPGTEIEEGGESKIFNSSRALQMQNFRANVKRYGRFTHQKNLKGYFIVVPYSKVDFTTGEPDQDLVATIARKMGVSQNPTIRAAA